jgi:hypothetical protein
MTKKVKAVKEKKKATIKDLKPKTAIKGGGGVSGGVLGDRH